MQYFKEIPYSSILVIHIHIIEKAWVPSNCTLRTKHLWNVFIDGLLTSLGMLSTISAAIKKKTQLKELWFYCSTIVFYFYYLKEWWERLQESYCYSRNCIGGRGCRGRKSARFKYWVALEQCNWLISRNSGVPWTILDKAFTSVTWMLSSTPIPKINGPKEPTCDWHFIP